MKRRIINLIITAVFAFVWFYLTIPAVNLSNPNFYSYLTSILIVFGLLEFGTSAFETIRRGQIKFKFNPILIVPVILVLITIVNFISSPLFNAKSYASRIVVDETGNFSEQIKEVDFSKTPLLDKASTQKLGDRVMGEMSDFVSQYYVSDLYTQINYNDDIVRVTPLEYADLIKYISNRKEGIKGYIRVNSVNGKAEVVRLENGMHYVPSAILNEDLMRHLRFKYPTYNFGSYTFETDDNGNPFFIVPIKKYSAIGLRQEITGVIALDPITGETTKYDVGEVPNWIDHVYSADLIIEQTDDWGTYQGGFWNSVFSQKNVVNTTDGYNYLAMDNDIFMYTGITSVQSDESNLGFILSNLRTKETVFYSVTGAEEYSAMASAEGQVQEMSYTSTFPLLINLNGRATYLMSLKDDAGLVKKYAFVDVADYQKVSVTDVSAGIEAGAKAYLNAFKLESSNATYQEKDITVASIKTVIIEGNTVYYITDTEKNKYSIDITVNKDLLPFMSVGDKYKIKYIENAVNIIKDIETSL